MHRLKEENVQSGCQVQHGISQEKDLENTESGSLGSGHEKASRWPRWGQFISYALKWLNSFPGLMDSELICVSIGDPKKCDVSACLPVAHQCSRTGQTVCNDA